MCRPNDTCEIEMIWIEFYVMVLLWERTISIILNQMFFLRFAERIKAFRSIRMKCSFQRICCFDLPKHWLLKCYVTFLYQYLNQRSHIRMLGSRRIKNMNAISTLETMRKYFVLPNSILDVSDYKEMIN